MTKVKICGITNPEDALLAIELGADELGFNFYAGSSRCIAPDAARQIVQELPNGTSATGVFVNMSIAGILEVLKNCWSHSSSATWRRGSQFCT